MANRYWSPIEDAQIILERALVYVGSLWGSNDSYQNAWSVAPPDTTDPDPEPNNDHVTPPGGPGGDGNPGGGIEGPDGSTVGNPVPADPDGPHHTPGGGPYDSPPDVPSIPVDPDGPGPADPVYYPIPDGADPSSAWRIRQWGRFVSIYDAFGVLMVSWAIPDDVWQGLGAVAYLWRYVNADGDYISPPSGASLGPPPVGLAFEVDPSDLWLKPVGFAKPMSYSTFRYDPDVLVVDDVLYVGELFQDSFVEAASFVRRGGRVDQTLLPYSVANLMWLAGYGSSLRMVQS